MYHSTDTHALFSLFSSRMDAVIGSLVQEMALLTEKLSSSKDDSVSLSGKLKLLK